MYAQEYEDPAVSKKKIILVSVIMGVIILALIGVLVSAIIRKKHLASAPTTNVPVTASIDDSSKAPSNSNLTPVSNDSNSSANGSGTASSTDNSASNTSSSSSASSSASASSSTSSRSASSSASSIPSTGPEASLLGAALLLGSATTYLVSKRELR